MSSKPLQIGLLSVGAVGACAFLIYQVMPKVQKATKTAEPQVQSATPRQTSDGPGLSLVVLGNPFSHPKLGQGKPGLEGELPPYLPELANLVPGMTHLPRVEGFQGAEFNTGESRKENWTLPRLVLSAVVRVDRPVAFIAVGTEESRPFSKGEIIAPGVRLVAIRDDSAIVRTWVGDFLLHVGGGKS